MIDIRNFNVQPAMDEALFVTWEAEATPEDLSDYRFSLKRMGSPVSDFESEGDLLIDSEPDVYQYIDDGLSLSSKYKKVWYLLKAVNSNTDAERVFGPIIMEFPADGYAMLIRSRNDYLLLAHTGKEVKVLKARTWGQRCSGCYDTVKKRKTCSTCEDCYNTGFYKGYFAPVSTMANLNPTPEQVKIANFGELEKNATVALFSYFPMLSNRDVVVEPTVNRRWRIVGINKTEKLRALVHQYVQMVELDPYNDVEFKINVQ